MNRLLCFCVMLCALVMITPSGTMAAPVIVAGDDSSFAIDGNGIVYAWGDNHSGRLGDGSDTNRSFPVQIAGNYSVISISNKSTHSAALTDDGTVLTWGSGATGRLGNGSDITGRYTPEAVAGISGVVDIAAGGNHTLALKSDGTVWAWGSNYYGQLGLDEDSYVSKMTTPVQVSNLTDVIQIAAGHDFSLALKSDGTVWAWGRGNLRGQLGTGYFDGSHVPVQTTNLSGVTQIRAFASWALALKSDGTVWAWGDNGKGQLGDGTTAHRATPGRVLNISNVVAIDAGESQGGAVTSEGSLWVWGSNSGGQLGNGTTTTSAITTPIQVTGLAGVTQIAVGGEFMIAMTSDGSVWAWGKNETGQLGDGTTTDALTPVQTLGPSMDGFLNLGENNVTTNYCTGAELDAEYAAGYETGYAAGLAAASGVPAKVTLVSPSGSVSAPITFTWNSVDNTGWYNLYVWDSNHSTIHDQWYETENNRQDYPEAACSDGTCTVTLSSGFNSGAYEFYVRSWNENGYGDWSGEMSFTITEDAPF